MTSTMRENVIRISLFVLGILPFISSDVSFANQYLNPSYGKLWNDEVRQVLHLLGVDRAERADGVDIPPKRAAEIEDGIDFNSVEHHIKFNHPLPPLKWQYTVITTVCSLAALVCIILTATCWFRIHKVSEKDLLIESRNSSPNGSSIIALGRAPSSYNQKLAQSAQMYHYQHQKQQMLALEKEDGSARCVCSDEDSEPEDFTVYECPGMTMDGELDVKNPLFHASAPSPSETK